MVNYMKNMQNLHTHTIYCDGKNTPEEMVQFAIDKGFDSLGFSGHSYMHYSRYGNISVENTELCNREVEALKEKYKGQLEIFRGLEVDIFSEIDMSGYDYLIGAVHYLKVGDVYAGFDRSAKDVQAIIDTHFGGDGMAFAKQYYETLSTLPEYGNFDIIGHFDLITKNIDIIPFFDQYSKEYLHMAFDAAHSLKGKIPFFEVNTGAISRGYRKTPYPSIPLLKELKELGFGATISSDCHDGNYLDCAFEDARELLMQCGFTERYILTESGFKAVEI